MKPIPIKEELHDNEEFMNNPLCKDSLQMTIEFYKRVGFVVPWIGYYFMHEGKLVGSGGFKGPPINGKVEIAYGTFESFRRKGIGTEICKQLVELSLQADPTARITARTLPNNNFSTRILVKNDFVFIGMVEDPEDGQVWEWEYV